MKAVYLTETGSPDVLTYGELPQPWIGPNDVLIHVKACSLNRLDVFTREGSHGTRITPPHVLGGDFAGEVVRVGEGVEAFKPSDRVIASGRGGYAELAVAQWDRVYTLPSRCTFDEGATLPVAGLTAWQMVMNRARVRPGEAVLITAAGSGVSTFAIQLCRTLGARVITTASSAEKLQKARVLGAEAGVDYTREDILQRVRDFTGGEGVDVVLEHVGTPVWNACFESLKPGGRFVTCGVTAGHRVELHLGRVFSRGLAIMGVGRGTPDDMHAFLKLVGQGKVHGIVYRTLPLSQAAEAHRIMEASSFFGKLVLNPG
ncbi:MAG TPA: zinc-binding dehydrogenase [Candidatus Tectomicrobia bacterium]|nr:zinc-binding dehydrogenase [Candidatus Tectomicrobia bacterium]